MSACRCGRPAVSSAVCPRCQWRIDLCAFHSTADAARKALAGHGNAHRERRPAPDWRDGPGEIRWPWCDYGCPHLSVRTTTPTCRLNGLPTDPDRHGDDGVASICIPSLHRHHLEHRRGRPILMYCNRCRFAVGHSEGRCLVCHGDEIVAIDEARALVREQGR